MRRARDKSPERQRGGVLVLIAVTGVLLIGMAALSIDVSHLIVVRNELQNAADAGALAGAAELYYRAENAPSVDQIGWVNPNANSIAVDAGTRNLSDRVAAEIPAADVQRGHWRFSSHSFTPSDSTVPIVIGNYTEAQLDAMDGSDGNPPFINAVRVVARRRDTPAASFLARILGYQNFILSADAVAYIGFAGTIYPAEVDQPIAICRQSIRDAATGAVACNVGRMINSGNNLETANTGGWTNFDQNSPTCSAVNASQMSSLVCAGGNPVPLVLGEPITTTGGMQTTTYNLMRNCWQNNSADGTVPWEITLPVVDCVGNNIGNCPDLVGAVTVSLLWMTGSGLGNVSPPMSMASPDPDNPALAWSYGSSQCQSFMNQVGSSTDAALESLQDLGDRGVILEGFADASRWQGEARYTTDMARWDCFVNHFQLRNVNNTLAPLAQKSLYFLPECDIFEPVGGTGGPNFGLLSQDPVLVK